MNIDQFLRAQKSMSGSALFSLFMSCRSRFLDSARLLEVYGPSIDALADAGVTKTVNLDPLLPSYQVLAKRYFDETFSPQLSVFPDLADTEEAKWSKFFYWALMPVLTQNDSVVRNVLRATLAIPCKSPEAAAHALEQECMEMSLPEGAHGSAAE